MLARVKHRNLMVLRGSFINQDVRLLLYDYMPNGSIASLLQEASQQTSHVLDRRMRHLIALGIARGISFLHTQCNPPIVHGDVKPNNLLFDADFEPHLSDFGLTASTRTPVDPTPSSSSVGSLGYVSPEAKESGELTQEADVYSFGIVLLELPTGRRPAVFNLQDEDIAKRVKRMLQLGEITEVFDPTLLDRDPESREREEFLIGCENCSLVYNSRPCRPTLHR
jgi:serine/threonine protein kinase